MRKWWKNPRFLGNAAYYLMHVISFTMRVKIVTHPTIDAKAPYLFAFWHGKQFLPALNVPRVHFTRGGILASPSRDGAIITTMLQKMGYEVIRGSSRDRAAGALLNVKRKLKQGVSMGFAIDGPIGPIHTVKPGMPFLAQKCNTAIIPIGSAYQKYWVFRKAWDKFQLPKPFTKAALVMGEPFIVSPEADIHLICKELENRINMAEAQAEQLLNN